MVYRITLLILLHSWLAAQNHQERFDQIDVQHYRFQLALSDNNNLIYGKTRIDIQFKEAVPSFTLDLVARQGKSSGGMLVKEVIDQNGPLPFSHKEETLTIQLKKTPKKDSIYSFVINYEGVPTDGLIIAQNKYGNRTFFGDNWPNRAHHWLPTVDHPSDKATVEFIITAPDHYQVIANGEQIEETNLTDSTKLTHWATRVPIPTKVMVIGVARFAVQLAGYVDTIPVTSWIYRKDRQSGFEDYKLAVDILHFFYQKMGSYPYEKLANVQSKTIYGGMENAGNIFYFENSVNGLSNQHQLIAHEIAHQWFGNSVSEQNWHHVWLSEGFATYFADIYLEEVHGVKAFKDNLKIERERAIQYAHSRPTPIINVAIQDYVQLLTPNVYQKAGWVLHMLRHEIGDEAFWQGIKAYYQKFKSSNALSKDFQSMMENTSGKKLDYFFQQWLYQPGHPVLNVEFKKSTNASTEITISQQQAFPFKFSLQLDLVNKKGEKSRKTIRIDSKKHHIKVEEELEDIIIDPDVQLFYELQ